MALPRLSLTTEIQEKLSEPAFSTLEMGQSFITPKQILNQENQNGRKALWHVCLHMSYPVLSMTLLLRRKDYVSSVEVSSLILVDVDKP